jgi:3-methyl-2-oxobutanoate hydroxymethyltransferase
MRVQMCPEGGRVVTGTALPVWLADGAQGAGTLYRGVVSDEQRPYGSSDAATAESLKRVRTRHFQRAKEQGIKITGLTSYDCLSAAIFDRAGIDFLLVGDSAGNAVFGYDTTIPVTTDELIPLCRAVVRAAKRALVVADMPFGSYENGPEEALHTAIRFMKETGAHAVKLEGGRRSAKQIRRIVRAGIPVMAHIGFTPQSEHGLGGHLIQGRGEAATELIRDAHAVEDAGAFAVVLEMVPSGVAAQVTEELAIPTISVGAGPHCDGQLMVWTDWAGFTTGRIPRFVKRYANIGEVLLDAATRYRDEVEAGVYPGPEHEYAD